MAGWRPVSSVQVGVDLVLESHHWNCLAQPTALMGYSEPYTVTFLYWPGWSMYSLVIGTVDSNHGSVTGSAYCMPFTCRKNKSSMSASVRFSSGIGIQLGCVRPHDPTIYSLALLSVSEL